MNSIELLPPRLFNACHVLTQELQAQMGPRKPNNHTLMTVPGALYALGEFNAEVEDIRALIEGGLLVAFDISAGRRAARYRPGNRLIQPLPENSAIQMPGTRVFSQSLLTSTYRSVTEGGSAAAGNKKWRPPRSALRILTRSVEFFRAAGCKKHLDLKWEEIFRALVPHRRPVVTGLEIREVLLCDRGHVENLMQTGELTVVQKSKPGPGGSWMVSRESFEQFLKNRRQ